MNRRQSIKALGVSALAAGTVLGGCGEGPEKEKIPEKSGELPAGRQAFEVERDKKLKAETFFTPHEMQTITVLVDIILPADEKSGSASDAKVPEFIEFIVKDIPDHQTPLRGGLRWLDMQCFSRYEKSFRESTPAQQLEMIHEIAYPLKAKPAMKPGVAFFNRLRDLTASGFYTTQLGIRDLGYQGNQATKWEGVPKDVLAQYGFEDIV